MYSHLSEKAERYLHNLCLEIPNRRVGSTGNRKATEFFAQIINSFGFQIECPEFECIDWEYGDVQLLVGGESYGAFISPYSLGCDLSALLMIASTVEELEAVEVSNKVLLLRGDITKEQLMPKNFTFYNPERHKAIVNLLEAKNPAAIIAATTRNPELAGGIYPFPLIEDGDFNIPSIYMTQEDGNRLSEYVGKEIMLSMSANRIPSKGSNVIARKGADSSRRIVICAHIDAKDNTPGALDNGTGVTVLLILAELLKDYAGNLEVEIVALNGEDYYSAPGQIQYLKDNEGRLNEVILAINLDLAGYYLGDTAYSLYDCPDEIDSSIWEAFTSHQGIIEGEQWYQSDHSIFIQNQVPAMAITSERFMWLSTHVTHTPKDRLELVDRTKLVHIALGLRDLILRLDGVK